MRIGVSTSVIQQGKTGIAAYVLALLRAFAACEDAPEFVIFALEADRELFQFAEGRFQIELIPERYRPPLRDIFWHQRVLPRLTERLGLDVLHVPSYRRLLWPRVCALVGTVHDLAPFRVAGKYDWKRMFYGRVLARQLATRQHRLIAVSQTTAEDMQSFWRLPAQRITVIHEGIDHQRFTARGGDAGAAAIRRRHGLNEPFFLYVARLEYPGKNHVRLIKAFERFKARTRSNWQLVLAGSDWHGAAAIHGAIRDSPARSDICCLGFVPDAELPGLYQAADVFVYPSLYEGFGFPPLEAMACGCPVLSSRRGALAEIVGNAAGELAPEDEEAMSTELQATAAEPQRRERLRAAGLERARQFDWNRTARETLAVYQAALREARMARMG